MNRSAIPIILTAIVIITGFFAFLPIDKASTVHNTIIGIGGLDLDDILNSQQAYQIQSDNSNGIEDNDTVVIDCDTDFVLVDSYWGIDDFDSLAGEALSIGNPGVSWITIDGVDFIGDSAPNDIFNLLEGVGNVNNVDVQVSWRAVAQDFYHQGGGVTNPETLFAQGVGNNDIVFTIFDAGGDPLDAADVLTVTALILTQSNADCSVTINS